MVAQERIFNVMYRMLKSRISLIYAGLWGIYWITELITGRITDIRHGLLNLIPLLFLYGMGILFSIAQKKAPSGYTIKKTIIAVSILSAFDQAVKFLFRHLATRIFFPIPIIPTWLYLQPVLNSEGSWLASRYNLPIGFELLTVINGIFLVIISFVYGSFKKRGRSDYWHDLAFILIMAGAFCSFVDKLVFKGSLDILMLQGLFVCDSKDFYLTLGAGAFIRASMLQPKKETAAKDSSETLSGQDMHSS